MQGSGLPGRECSLPVNNNDDDLVINAQKFLVFEYPFIPIDIYIYIYTLPPGQNFGSDDIFEKSSMVPYSSPLRYGYTGLCG